MASTLFPRVCVAAEGQMLEVRIPRRLESPNTWNGRHWRYKHRISQEWESAIGGAFYEQIAGAPRDFVTALGCMVGPRKWEGIIVGRQRVEVERHVPSVRNFIRDDDNLRFAVKPLLDALKRQGYIKNDSRKWLDHPTPTQHVSANGKDYTVIRISPVELAMRQAT